VSHGVSTRWHTVYAVAHMQGHFPLTRLLTLSRPGCVRVLDLVPISFLKNSTNQRTTFVKKRVL